MKDYCKYLIDIQATIRDALVALNNLSHDVLVLFVMDDKQKIVGTLTDGDIRRYLIGGGDVNGVVMDAMQTNFHFVQSNVSLSLIRDYKKRGISLIPCLDTDGHLLKVIDLKNKKSLLPIDAVLMAGGKGERLRPKTE